MLKLVVVLLGIFIVAIPTPLLAASRVDLRAKSLTFLQQNIQYQAISRNLDFNHTLHLRLQETYNGYPLWGVQAVVHLPHARPHWLLKPAASLVNAAVAAKLTGIVYYQLAQDLQAAPAAIFQPAQAEKAFQKALSFYQQQVSVVVSDLADQQSRLGVYIDKHQKAHWAFFVHFLTETAQGLPVKPSYLLDAQTFQVYRYWDNIQTQQLKNHRESSLGGGLGGNPKMGKLIYDGLAEHLPSLAIERDAESQTCYLKNTTVVVRDVRQQNALKSYPCTAVDPEHNNLFWNGDHDAVNGSYSPSNDALFNGKVVQAMYQQWYGIPVLTTTAGQPMRLVMRVHKDMDNAYWDGRQMTFGDGVSLFYPLVSLGVSAHEISHGFTEQHSNLFYLDQSGGLNEAFSDMAAQAAEFYVNGHNSWQIGGEVMKAKNRVLRYLDHPSKDCAGRKTKEKGECSIEQLSDYYDGLNVHFSSGIFNRAFYLIATAPGWDTHKAFNIMVQANMNYWTPLSSFTEAACDVIVATEDYQYPPEAVSNAFTAVGIDSQHCV